LPTIGAVAKAAIDAGDLERARGLLDLLDAKPRSLASRVLTLATKRPVS
jgi:hypothetical protein